MNDAASDLAALIARLESHIDPAAGKLPDEIFLLLTRLTPLVNVDLLIQDGEKGTLLTWRSDRHFGPGWHVPGGIIRLKERAADRVREVARLELGVTVTFDPAPILVQENIRPAWRDRGHAISLLYRCRLAGPPDPRQQYIRGAPRPDQWQWYERCPENLIPEQRAYAHLLG